MTRHRDVSVVIIEKTPYFETTIETIRPGGKIFSHYHPDLEFEYTLSDNLVCNGVPIKAGTFRTWRHCAVHGYENLSKEPAYILSKYYGRWKPEKEILV